MLCGGVDDLPRLEEDDAAVSDMGTALNPVLPYDLISERSKQMEYRSSWGRVMAIGVAVVALIVLLSLCCQSGNGDWLSQLFDILDFVTGP